MSKKLRVSDHARVRYIQRAYEIDMDAVDDQIREHLKGAPTDQNFIFNGFVVKKGSVVTYTGRKLYDLPVIKISIEK